MTNKDSIIKQPGFHGKYPAGFFDRASLRIVGGFDRCFGGVLWLVRHPWMKHMFGQIRNKELENYHFVATRV